MQAGRTGRCARRLLAAALAWTVLAAPLETQAATSGDIQAEIDGLAGQKSAIQSRMDEIEAEIESLDSERSTTLEKKLLLDARNQAAQEELDVIQEQIDIVDGLLFAVENDLTEARAAEAYQRQLWLGRVREMEESPPVGYLEVLFQATSFSDLLTRMDVISEVAAYDESLEAQYLAAQENVLDLEAQAREMYERNDASRREWEDKKAQLDTDIAAACALIENMDGDLDEYSELLTQQAADRDALSALIVSKEAELAAARRAEEEARLAALAAQQGQTGGTAPPAPSGDDSGGSGDDDSGSAGSGGGSSSVPSGSGAWMIWPSYTRWLTDHFGPRQNHPVLGGYAHHDGVDIGASYGSNIWAAAGGTVILAGNYGGYGSCVMINHGNGYTTVYGHMSSISVTVGQSVSQGQVIGHVGSSGISSGPHLHFEIRSSATAAPIDPMSFSYLA